MGKFGRDCRWGGEKWCMEHKSGNIYDETRKDRETVTMKGL